MAENLLEMGPPSSKRPKLNSPALSASDGPGKGLPSTPAHVNIGIQGIVTYDIRDRTR